MQQLLIQLGRTWVTNGMYGVTHPVSLHQVQLVLPLLAGRIDHEPGKRLLLGVVRDRFLYRDRFFGKGKKVVRRLTERLYAAGIATLVFEQQLSTPDLQRFLHCLSRNGHGDNHEAIQADLSGAGVSGIRIFPYHYKELLSRRTVEVSKRGKDSAQRGEFLLRSLMSADFAKQDDEEQKVIEEIVKYPDLLTAVLKHASAPLPEGIPDEDGRTSPSDNRISPEVLKRLFNRIGSALVKLSPPERGRIVRSLEAGIDVAGSPERNGENGLELTVAQALAADRSGEEFLELLGTILTVENKSSGRLRKIFEVLAVDRNRSRPFLPAVSERVRESLRARDFYSLKTWESVEKLLLDRTEEPYVSKDHFRLLESISEGMTDPGPVGAVAPPDPDLAASLGTEEQRIRNTEIMLELLVSRADDENLHDLVEEFRKIVPNLISRGDLPLLKKVLLGLLRASENIRDDWRPAIREILREVDYWQLIEWALERFLPTEQREEIHLLLTRLAPEAIETLLDRMLSEENRTRRRSILRMAVLMGPPCVPPILERMHHPKWYFVRNLCSILGDIADRRALPALLQATAHPDYRVRREAVTALGRIRPPEAVPVLGAILSNEGLFEPGDVVSVRIAAALTLHRIGGTDAESYLHAAAASRRPEVRDLCRKLLRNQEVPR